MGYPVARVRGGIAGQHFGSRTAIPDVTREMEVRGRRAIRAGPGRKVTSSNCVDFAERDLSLSGYS